MSAEFTPASVDASNVNPADWASTVNAAIADGSLSIAKTSGLQTELNRIGRVYSATAYGASPGATAAANVTAIQSALDAADAAGGGIVIIDAAGIYLVHATLIIHSNTTLEGVGGVTIKKSGTNFGNIIRNAGASTRTLDTNITLRNLHFDTGGNQVNDGSLFPVYGLIGQVAFYYANDVLMDRVSIYTDTPNQYTVHFVSGVGFVARDCFLNGAKDGFHCSNASKLRFYNCTTTVEDDAYPMLANEWDDTSPEIGPIFDVRIVDCDDYTIADQTGNFFRATPGAWTDWTSGFSYYSGDTVVSSGRTYKRSGTKTGLAQVSTVAPTHATGSVTGGDGVAWRMVNSAGIYKADVTNVRILNCRTTSSRPFALLVLNSVNGDNRTTTPGQEDVAFIDDLLIQGCHFKPDTSQHFITANGWVKNLTVEGTRFSTNTRSLFNASVLGGSATVASNLKYFNTIIEGPFISDSVVVNNRPGLTLNVTLGGTTYPSGQVWSAGNIYPVRFIYSDLPIKRSIMGGGLPGDFSRSPTDGSWTEVSLGSTRRIGRDFASGHVRELMTNPTLTSLGVSAAAATRTNTWVYLYPGTAATGWARAVLSTGGTYRPTSGIHFGVPVRLLTTFTVGANTGIIHRVIYGEDNTLATPPNAAADALTRKGFGFEVRRNGANYEARIFSHDGTTYSAAASWVDLGATSTSNPYGFALAANGTSWIKLYTALPTSFGQLPVFGDAAQTKTTNIPTGTATAATDNAISVQTVADGTTGGGGAGGMYLLEARMEYQPVEN